MTHAPHIQAKLDEKKKLIDLAISFKGTPKGKELMQSVHDLTREIDAMLRGKRK